jgi:hypothetical protein
MSSISTSDELEQQIDVRGEMDILVRTLDVLITICLATPIASIAYDGEGECQSVVTTVIQTSGPSERTFVKASTLEPSSLDPAYDYEEAGMEVLQNVYETLIRHRALAWSGSEDHRTDTGLTNGLTYSYKVSANNSLGWGQNSTEVLATPMGGGDVQEDAGSMLPSD